MLDGSRNGPVGLGHPGLRGLMPPTKSQVLHNPDDIVNVVELYDLRAEYSPEELQSVLHFQRAFDGDRVVSHVSGEKGP